MAGDGLREAAVERLARRRCIQAGHDPDVPSIGLGWLGSPYWLEWSEEAAADIADHHALLDQRGFAVVPKVATEAEIDAAYEATKATQFVRLRQDISIHTLRTLIRETRAAMLAASRNPLEAPDGP